MVRGQCLGGLSSLPGPRGPANGVPGSDCTPLREDSGEGSRGRGWGDPDGQDSGIGHQLCERRAPSAFPGGRVLLQPDSQGTQIRSLLKAPPGRLHQMPSARARALAVMGSVNLHITLLLHRTPHAPHTHGCSHKRKRNMQKSKQRQSAPGAAVPALEGAQGPSELGSQGPGGSVD